MDVFGFSSELPAFPRAHRHAWEHGVPETWLCEWSHAAEDGAEEQRKHPLCPALRGVEK